MYTMYKFAQIDDFGFEMRGFTPPMNLFACHQGMIGQKHIRT